MSAHLVDVRRVTRDRMNLWADVPDSAYTVLPNADHLDRYGMRRRSQDLMARYGLHDGKVNLTLARLPGAERGQGRIDGIE